MIRTIKHLVATTDINECVFLLIGFAGIGYMLAVTI